MDFSFLAWMTHSWLASPLLRPLPMPRLPLLPFFPHRIMSSACTLGCTGTRVTRGKALALHGLKEEVLLVTVSSPWAAHHCPFSALDSPSWTLLPPAPSPIPVAFLIKNGQGLLVW